jgi:hypothetical protein
VLKICSQEGDDIWNPGKEVFRGAESPLTHTLTQLDSGTALKYDDAGVFYALYPPLPCSFICLKYTSI